MVLLVPIDGVVAAAGVFRPSRIGTAGARAVAGPPKMLWLETTTPRITTIAATTEQRLKE